MLQHFKLRQQQVSNQRSLVIVIMLLLRAVQRTHMRVCVRAAAHLAWSSPFARLRMPHSQHSNARGTTRIQRLVEPMRSHSSASLLLQQLQHSQHSNAHGAHQRLPKPMRSHSSASLLLQQLQHSQHSNAHGAHQRLPKPMRSHSSVSLHCR
jgi:hypothetical protein